MHIMISSFVELGRALTLIETNMYPGMVKLNQVSPATKGTLHILVIAISFTSGYYGYQVYLSSGDLISGNLREISDLLNQSLPLKNALHNLTHTVHDYVSVPIVDAFNSAKSMLRFDGQAKHGSRDTLEKALTYSKTDKVDVSIEEARRMVNSLHYLMYKESNTCDIFEGIDGATFDAYIEDLAMEIGLPEKLTSNIKMSRRGKRRVRGVQNFTHRKSNGTLYFGRFAVIRRGEDEFDLAYSIHSLTYELSPENAGAQGEWWKTGEKQASISNAFEDGFFGYFQHKAIDRFNQQCAAVLGHHSGQDGLKELLKVMNKEDQTSQGNTE